MTRSRPERFTAIMKAHVAALGDRDHRDVSAAELFPKIAEAVPGVTHEEIIAAFQHTADRATEQARQLLPTFPSGRIHDILNCVIHAPDRTALAIAFAQGHEAGSEGSGSPEDVPDLPHGGRTHARGLRVVPRAHRRRQRRDHACALKGAPGA
jgi:hypothetical protein